MCQVNGLLVVHYDLGNAEESIVEVRGPRGGRLDDSRYHYVTIVRHANNVSVQVDDLPARFRIHGL